MSIASELAALNGYILGAYDEINTKGGTVPANKNMANLASAISSIETGGGGGSTIEGFNVISGKYTPTVTAYDAILMPYDDFMSAVGGTIPAFCALCIFSPATDDTGFSHKFGFIRKKTSPHYVNSSGSMSRGSMSTAFAIVNPATSSHGGVWTTGYNGNGTTWGHFQAGVEYIWFILWKN